MKIQPFRGVRYNVERIGDLSRVVTQPYDKISDALRDEYLARHPASYVRVIKGPDEAGDGPSANRYTRARDAIARWLADGTLVGDPEPAVYVYHQVFEIPGRGALRRKGFLAAAGLEELGAGTIRPHEATHAGPKADRLELLRATGCHTEPVFLLYDDPGGAVNRLLDEAIRGQAPLLAPTDDFGTRHEVWPVTDPATIAEAAARLAGAPVLIADGHHRYETALNYRCEMRARGARCRGAESFENILATFVNLHDPALFIYPGHRIVFDVEEDRVRALLEGARAHFEVEAVPVTSGDDAVAAFVRRLAEEGKGGGSFGLFIGGEERVHLLRLKDPGLMARLAPDRSAAWRSLDVAVLHMALLAPLLGVTADDLEHERKVRFARHAREAIAEVRAGRARLAFLLNPTKIEQVRDVAAAGERMPQKSTDFFPKLLSGLVLLRMDFAHP